MKESNVCYCCGNSLGFFSIRFYDSRHFVFCSEKCRYYEGVKPFPPLKDSKIFMFFYNLFQKKQLTTKEEGEE